MTLSMHQASVPVFAQGLKGLDTVLAKGKAGAEARGFDPAVLVQARLYPDMFPLARQVQIACDFAKGAAARLAGAEVPSWADDETSFEALAERIARTQAFIAGFKPEEIDGSEEREVTLKIGGEPRTFSGATYLLHMALPNFYFHLSTAYAILRKNGVEVGKRDFLGA